MKKSVREKCCPRVKIPNFNLRDILRRLGAPNQRSIWLNFTQFFPKFTHVPQGGCYIGWKVSIDVIWATYYVGTFQLM